MTSLVAKPIKSIRKRPLQPLHPRHQVRLRRLDREMVVIAHQHIREKPPVAPLNDLKETFLKSLTTPAKHKKIPPVISAVEHMIHRTGIFYAILSGHPSKKPDHKPAVNI